MSQTCRCIAFVIVCVSFVLVVENRSYNNGLIFYDLQTYIAYLPPTVSVSRGRGLSSAKYSDKGSIWSHFGQPCECSGLVCGCCAGIKVKQYNYDQKMCANMTFVPAKEEALLEVFLNEKSSAKYGVAARNPSPFCIPVMMGIPMAMCVQMSDVGLQGNNLNMCMDFIVRLATTDLFEMHFQCMRMGLDGVQYLDKNGQPVIPPSNSKTQTSSDYEYYDETADSANEISNYEGGKGGDFAPIDETAESDNVEKVAEEDLEDVEETPEESINETFKEVTNNLHKDKEELANIKNEELTENENETFKEEAEMEDIKATDDRKSEEIAEINEENMLEDIEEMVESEKEESVEEEKFEEEMVEEDKVAEQKVEEDKLEEEKMEEEKVEEVNVVEEKLEEDKVAEEKVEEENVVEEPISQAITNSESEKPTTSTTPIIDQATTIEVQTEVIDAITTSSTTTTSTTTTSTTTEANLIIDAMHNSDEASNATIAPATINVDNGSSNADNGNDNDYDNNDAVVEDENEDGDEIEDEEEEEGEYDETDDETEATDNATSGYSQPISVADAVNPANATETSDDTQLPIPVTEGDLVAMASSGTVSGAAIVATSASAESEESTSLDQVTTLAGASEASHEIDETIAFYRRRLFG